MVRIFALCLDRVSKSRGTVLNDRSEGRLPHRRVFIDDWPQTMIGLKTQCLNDSIIDVDGLRHLL